MSLLSIFKRKRETDSTGKTVVELNLWPDDVLLVLVDGVLRTEQRKSMQEFFRDVLDKPGQHVVVLEQGVRVQVVHRPQCQHTR